MTDPTEREFFVHVEHYWTYRVTAESPEQAEQIVADGDGGEGDCTGWHTVAVTADGDQGDDLRQPLICRGGCGKQLDPSSNGECTPCLLRTTARLAIAPTRVAAVLSDWT